MWNISHDKSVIENISENVTGNENIHLWRAKEYEFF